MNRRFLADALDFWKGDMLLPLQQRGALRNLRVEPMFTDPPWPAECLDLYCKLLRIRPAELVEHWKTLENREDYFGEVPAAGDLFLDPDTGIQPRVFEQPERYVNFEELSRLLLRRDRVAVVYQHVRGGVLRRLQAVTARLHDSIVGVSCCSACSATVALIFISLDSQRIDYVRSELDILYGPKSHDRVHTWPAA